MKKFFVIDGIMEGTKFDGYLLNNRYINTDTIGQSYPMENVRANNFWLDNNFHIKISDYIESVNNTIYQLQTGAIKAKDIYGTGNRAKAITTLKKRLSELYTAQEKYGNESILKLEYKYNVYLSYT